MALPINMFLLPAGLRKFGAQVAVSVAATICATALYGHFVSPGSPFQQQPEAVFLSNAFRVEGGVIDTRTLAYYPEHLAALDSLIRFHPVSAQRTAELAGELRSTRIASVSGDAARSKHVASTDALPTTRPAAIAPMNMLPPRRPAAPAPAPTTVAANSADTTPARAKFWGVEIPHFVPTGAAVIDKLATMKDRIGGLMHVSSR
jgi:hypothetical protein